MTIRIAGTVNDSIVDGPGIRFTVFTQGCPHNCRGCHNPQTHDFNGGRDEQISTLVRKINSNPLLDGVTFSGGEPFCQAAALAQLAGSLDDTLDIMTYTGYTFEYLLENADDNNHYMDLLECTDILVDGRFEIDKMSYELVFKGSSNQRILDCKKSLSLKEAQEYIL
ncbi:MAG: anaerobic ribonucleoside-triphosphate reductase activating protein [Oscillospiraceae bacterium]|nr:anaerobic ribonucleoside-triphosphate reductase activating protein [Oscillospiraceae bacterium]